MKVYVVMSNDYPDSVWTTKEAAVDYVEKRKLEAEKTGFFSRIYWRYCEFELQGEPPTFTVS